MENIIKPMPEIKTKEEVRLDIAQQEYDLSVKQYSAGAELDVNTIYANEEAVINSKLENEASVWDKTNAFLKTAYGHSPAAKAITTFAIEQLSSGVTKRSDPEFIKNNNTDYKMARLYEAGLPISTYNTTLLSNAKNKEDFDFFLGNLKVDQEFADSVKYLTQGQQTASAITGVLSDPTYLAYTPAKLFQALQGGVRLSAVVGSNMALQYTLSKARDYGEPNRTTDDMLLDVAFGGVFDSFFAMKSLGKIDAEFASKLAQHHSESRAFSDAVHTTEAHKFDFTQNYSWSATAIKETPEAMSVSEVVAKYKPTKVDEVIKVTEPSEIQLTAEAKAAATAQDIATYQLAVGAKLAKAITKSGLSEEVYMDIYNNIARDLPDIKALIKSAINESDIYKTKLVEDLQDGLENIGKVSPSAKAQIEQEIEALLGRKIEQKPALVKTDREIHFVNGHKAFKKKIKQFDNVIKSKVNELKSAVKATAEFKALKPLVKELDKGEQTLLAKTQAKMDKISAEIDAKAIAGVDEAKLQKLYDEHARLSDIETTLMHKLEIFKQAKAKSSVALLGKQKELYERMASVMDELVFEINNSFKNIFADSLSTPAEKALFKKNLEQDLSKALGQEIKVAEKDGSFIIKGDIKFDVKGEYAYFGKNKIMVATLLALGGGSSLMADDGKEITLSNAWFFLIMGALGIQALRAIKNHGGLVQSMKVMGSKMAGIQKLAIFASDDKTKRLMESRNQVIDAGNTGFINSIETVMKKGNAESRALAQRLGFDAVNPQKVMSAMVDRLINMREDIRIFREAEEINFKAWLSEQGLKETIMDRLLASGAETMERERFLNEVTDYVEFGKSASNSKHVAEQARIMSEIMGNTATKATAMKVVGFAEDIIGKIKNYVPRVPAYENIRTIASASPEAMKDLVLNIGRAIEKTHGTPSAEIMELSSKLVDGYLSVGVHSVNPQRIEDILSAMKKAGFDTEGVNATELAATIRSNNDAISRGKLRIDMDMSYFKPFKYTVDGVEHTATQAIVYERNAGTLLNQHSSQIHGMIALKKATKGLTLADGTVVKNGIESEFGLRQIISKEINPEVQEVLNTYVDAILGHPLYNASSIANRIVSILRDLSYARLALTQFAMASEYATAIAHMLHNQATMRQGLNHLSNLIKGMVGIEGANTALSNRIASLTGLGTSVLRRESSFKNLEGMYNVSELAGKSGTEKFASGVKYISLIASRILHADDALKRIAGVYHTDNLMKFVDGKITMSANRMERFGIDDKFIETFKGKFGVNSKGELLDNFDESWTPLMREQYANVLFKMIMTDSPEAIVSSLPIVSSTSSAGRLVGFMTNFAAQTYTTKALGGLKRPDGVSAIETTIYFLGTYAGIYARDLASGKDPKQEDVMYRTIMMMPLTAPYGILSMMSDPMSTSIVPDTFMQMDRIRRDLSDD